MRLVSVRLPLLRSAVKASRDKPSEAEQTANQLMARSRLYELEVRWLLALIQTLCPRDHTRLMRRVAGYDREIKLLREQVSPLKDVEMQSIMATARHRWREKQKAKSRPSAVTG